MATQPRNRRFSATVGQDRVVPAVCCGRSSVQVKDVKVAFVMNPKDFKQRYHVEKPDQTKDVIFSCRSGRRALIAAEKLEELDTYHK
ncbi:hypothetical protein HPB52_019510 [Rhipicephalus sanguineus]|uniref:Rhodanese domain-containing protein n=1 Tax=Rhipicephalus sanguineus TaxID=34632 RepID=A0A9D4Q2A6_RHISA|nr:hypothetical protein HPB52_019510 [Rhipicephalus sanguineus]